MISRLIPDTPEVRPTRGGHTSRANLRMESGAGRCSLVGGWGFHVVGPERIDAGVSAHFPVALVIAMRLGLPLRAEGELPPAWERNFHRFQEIYRLSFEGFSMVNVDATWREPGAPGGSAEEMPTGGFFSTGVDAFHVASRPDVRVLIHVDGLDSTIRDAQPKPLIGDVVARAAGDLGLPLWRVSTDARCLLDGLLWHGEAGTAMLGGCARLFAGTLGSVVLGASDIWLSHKIRRSDHYPITRCFGAEDLGFTIDGLNRRRVEKIGALGGSRPFMAHPVECREVAPPSDLAARQGKASFFSGGVDSTHSVLRHKADLSQLIFVVGFDIDVDNKPLAEEVTAAMRAASDDFGIPLLHVETDVRKFSEGLVWWGSHYCGAAMAGVGYLIAPLVRSVLIPGTMTWSAPGPFGTHPLTDEMWSTGAPAFEHDGCDTPRLEKFRAICAREEGLKHLRVCWRNPGNAYNCGKCEKCLRAMANLRALGLLGRCPTFPDVLDTGDIKDMEIHHPLVLPFLRETLEEAGAKGDEDLCDALRGLITRHEVDCLAKEPKEVLEKLGQCATWREKTVPRFRDAVVAACLANDAEWTRGKLLQPLPGEERRALLRDASGKGGWKRLFRGGEKNGSTE